MQSLSSVNAPCDARSAGTVSTAKRIRTHLPEPCEHLIRYECSLIEYRVSEDYDTGYDISGRGEYQSDRDDTLEDQLEGKTWDDLWMVYNKLREHRLEYDPIAVYATGFRDARSESTTPNS